jgi:ABC-type Fe3+-siderophore transport system permease subunit
MSLTPDAGQLIATSCVIGLLGLMVPWIAMLLVRTTRRLGWFDIGFLD